MNVEISCRAFPASPRGISEPNREALYPTWTPIRVPEMSESIGQSELVDRVIAEMHRRWQSDDQVLADSYVRLHPDLESDHGLLSRVVLAEFQLRHEFGDHPDPDEYIRRFPQLADRLPNLLQSEPFAAATSRPDHCSDSTQPVGSPPVDSKRDGFVRSSSRPIDLRFRNGRRLRHCTPRALSAATSCSRRSPAAEWGSFTKHVRLRRTARWP